MSLLLKNIAFLIRNPELIETNCDLLIEGSRISRIGVALEAPPGAAILDACGCAVIPGLINAHTHLYQNFLKGVSKDLSLIPWVNDLLFPTVAAILESNQENNSRPAYLWTAMAAIEMMRGGVTCCINMDVTDPDSLIAWRELGMRGVAAYTLTNTWVPAELRSDELKSRRKVAEFIQEWHEPGGMIQVFPAPSTPYLCDDGMLSWVRDLAEEMDLGVQIHVAEVASEVDDARRDWGMTPVERLHRLELLTPRLSAVHCVHVSQTDIDLLAAGGVSVVHCPKSNMKLADGVMPVNAMLKAGLSVSIANDGCGSNDLLDMWEEMRSGVLLARVTTGDPAALSAQDAFRMATIEPAKACRIDAGQIDPGRLADLAVIELRAAHLRPLHPNRILNTLVFCGKASDVRHTIINGELVMKDRALTSVDENAIFTEADQVEAPLYQRRASFCY